MSVLISYIGLFSLCFLAATVLPFSSEAALAGLVVYHEALVLPVLVATLGNVLGSATTFWLGWRARSWMQQATPRTAQRLAQAQRWLERWGPPLLLGGWVPLVGDALVGVAGAMRLPVRPCMLWISVGKLGRYCVVALAAQALI